MKITLSVNEFKFQILYYFFSNWMLWVTEIAQCISLCHIQYVTQALLYLYVNISQCSKYGKEGKWQMLHQVLYLRWPCILVSPGPSISHFVELSQQSIQLSISLGFFFKESIINTNIELLVNELGGHSYNTRNFHHDLMQYILLIQTRFGYMPRDPGKPVDNTKSYILKVLQMG